MKPARMPFAVAFFFMFVFSAAAQDETPATDAGKGTADQPYIVPRIESDIRIDGSIDEEAWRTALALELKYEVSPGENVPAPVRTEVLLAYGRSHIYAAFRSYDPDPTAIRATLRDRDRLGNDDFVGLVLDTFNDQRRSFVFLVTPLGVQADIIEAAQGDDDGWDTIWDSAGRTTEWGYAVEIAIPFSSLRFQRSDGPQVWGLDALRRYPRDHSHLIGLFPRDRNNNIYLSQAIKIKGFEGVSPGRNIEINPTVTAIRSDERADFPRGGMEERDSTADIGLNTRWGITPNMAMSFTANPDFSQVEADAYQLDINQPFALYYPERRPFFTEGGDIFDTLEDIVYTRTMRDPSWGLKLTGKEGANTIGAYVVRDRITNIIFPGSQSSRSTSLLMENTAAAFRYKRDLGGRYTVGLMATDREAGDYFNRVLGVDLDFRLTRTDQVQLLALGSSAQYPADTATRFGQKDGAFSDRLISFEYDHTSRNWGWWADYEEAGEGFRADLGFYPQVGYRNVEGGWSYNWIAGPGRWWSNAWIGGEANYYEELSGKPLTRMASLWFQLRGAMQSGLFARVYQIRELFNEREFDRTTLSASGWAWLAGNVETTVSFYVGDRVDYAHTRPGRLVQFNPGVSANLGRNFRFEFSHSFQRMTAADAHLYTANVSQLVANYQFNIRTFFRAILQYVQQDFNPANYAYPVGSEFKQLFSQLLFSYTINARTVLFLGYSDNYYGGRDFSLTQADRTFFVKLGYAWVL